MPATKDITKFYWLHAVTPLHVGEGFGIGAIDLPIVRERATGWPLVPGSAIKGVISDRFGASDKDVRKENAKFAAAFGTGGEDLSNSGALVFTDSRIVALPVRSDFGTFAWVTSKDVLMRLKRDLDAAGMGNGLSADINVAEDAIHLPASSALKGPGGKVCIADIDLSGKDCPLTKTWAEKLGKWLFTDAAWQTEFCKRFTLVPGDTFNFLAENATEIAARIRIDPEKKTVVPGGLWYEEYLPAETILAGLVWCDQGFAKKRGFAGDVLVGEFCKNELLLQIGGKATVGKGRTRCIFGDSNA